LPSEIIRQFNGGELTPHIDARSDTEKYGSGCRVLENMLPLPWGDVERRPGTEYVATAKNVTEAIRLIPFIYSASIAYVCEFGDKYIRLYRGGTLSGPPISLYIDEIASPYLVDDLPAIQYKQLGDVMWLVHPSYPPMKLSRTDAVTFSLDEIEFTNGPFLKRNDFTNKDGVVVDPSVTALDATGTLTAYESDGSTPFALFVAGHVGALWQIVQKIPESKLSLKIKHDDSPNYSSSDSTIIKGAFTFSTTGSWVGTVQIEFSLDNGSNWEVRQQWVHALVTDSNYIQSFTETADSVIYRITVPSTDPIATGTLYANILLQDTTHTGVVRIDSLISTSVANITVMVSLASTVATPWWSEGAWSPLRGYPAAIAFMSDRIAYASTPWQTRYVWFSATDDYEDFDAGLADADSFAVPLLMTDTIRWIEAVKGNVLAIGTTGGNWTISTNRLDQPLSPTNFSATQVTSHEAKDRQAIRCDNAALFIDGVSRKIHEFAYVYADDAYRAPDMTIMAEHVTAGGIEAMAFQKNPERILWTVRDDGTLPSMTYDREQKVIAWARHVLGLDKRGVVKDICVIPGVNEDQIWLSVLRVVNESQVMYIERMTSRTFAAIEDCFYVDCGVRYDFVTPTDTLTGLVHLQGETVAILADGAVYPTQVVSNDRIVLPKSVSKAAVGLPYRYTLEPMRIDIATAGGTSRSRQAKITGVAISFLNSAGVMFGKSVDALYPIAFRTTEPYDSPPALFTGDKKMVMNGGFNPENPIVISGTDPLPCTVRAIIAQLDVTG
jgi:hypothetical protein